MTRYMLVIASVMWSGLSFGAVKYKCDGEWVDYWPCDKGQADNRADTDKAIQAMKDQFAARAAEPEPDMDTTANTSALANGCDSEDVKCFADKARSDALIPCKHSIESRARYDFEWTDSLFGKPLFEFDYMWGIPPNVVVYYGSALKAQNGFGAWKEMYYQCWYNVRTSQIERVVLR